MGRNGVTYKEIAQAAERLQRQGINPTVIRVIEITGGSAGTVGKHLKRWRGIQTGEIDCTQLPPDLMKKVAELYQEVRKTGEKEAETLRIELNKAKKRIVELEAMIEQMKSFANVKTDLRKIVRMIKEGQ